MSFYLSGEMPFGKSVVVFQNGLFSRKTKAGKVSCRFMRDEMIQDPKSAAGPQIVTFFGGDGGGRGGGEAPAPEVLLNLLLVDYSLKESQLNSKCYLSKEEKWVCLFSTSASVRNCASRLRAEGYK